jgi:hypothetical protein
MRLILLLLGGLTFIHTFAQPPKPMFKDVEFGSMRLPIGFYGGFNSNLQQEFGINIPIRNQSQHYGSCCYFGFHSGYPRRIALSVGVEKGYGEARVFPKISLESSVFSWFTNEWISNDLRTKRNQLLNQFQIQLSYYPPNKLFNRNYFLPEFGFNLCLKDRYSWFNLKGVRLRMKIMYGYHFQPDPIRFPFRHQVSLIFHLNKEHYQESYLFFVKGFYDSNNNNYWISQKKKVR